MSQWKDKSGRPWLFRLTIGDAKRLKDAGYDIADPEAFHKFFRDTITCVEIIAEAMRSQWKAENLTYEQFIDLITEDVGSLQEVQKCFVEALKDFFHRLGENAMATIVEKAVKATIASKAAMAARAESPRIDQMVQKALEKEESVFHELLDAEEAKIFGPKSTNAEGS